MFSNNKINLPLGTLLILRNLRCDYSQQTYRYSMPAEFFTRIKVSPKHPFSAAEYCVNSHNYSLSSYSGLTFNNQYSSEFAFSRISPGRCLALLPVTNTSVAKEIFATIYTFPFQEQKGFCIRYPKIKTEQPKMVYPVNGYYYI